MKSSVVWCYQELARRVGSERMQKWVTALHYGNEDTWVMAGHPRHHVEIPRER